MCAFFQLGAEFGIIDQSLVQRRVKIARRDGVDLQTILRPVRRHALAEALDAHKVIVCPAFPGMARSIYQGHLFVNDVLLSESGMENHPLTPMTDPDIRRWLAPQTKFDVGHVAASAVWEGPEGIAAAMDKQHDTGKRLIVVDATRDSDLMDIGVAASQLPLITGGAGIAVGLPENFRRMGLISSQSNNWSGEGGKCAILSGSCPNATRA